MPSLILHELQQRGFVGIECVCLTGLPALTVEQLKVCIHQVLLSISWDGVHVTAALNIELLKCVMLNLFY